MKEQTIAEANRAAIAVLMTVLWEFFSYFGMRALLILYLTTTLNFGDVKAYSLFGAYITLIFLTPIIGGFIADRALGRKLSIYIGSGLMIVGHLTLGLFTSIHGFLLGLAWLIVGVGFFKTNAICLVADCYQRFPEKQDGAFVWYYVMANVGGTLGPLVCALVAKYYGWNWGFATAGVGMLIGLLTLFSQRRYLDGIGAPKVEMSRIGFSFLGLGIVASLLVISVVIWQNWAGWLLVATGLAVLPMVVATYRQSGMALRKSLIYIFILTFFGTVFWVFDQQGGSSISLFLLRDVNRQWGGFTVPTAWFQSINSAVIILGGPIVALLWRVLKKKKINLKSAFKMLFGLLSMLLGFLLIFGGEHLALAAQMKSNMIWTILGLMLIGFAELFIDPVVLGEINKSAPAQSKGFLTGLYYLCVGAYANYLSVQVAKLSVFSSHGLGLKASAQGYLHEFGFIIFIIMLSVILLSLIGVVFKVKNGQKYS